VNGQFNALDGLLLGEEPPIPVNRRLCVLVISKWKIPPLPVIEFRSSNPQLFTLLTHISSSVIF